MKPVYERFIENPDFTRSEFVELIKTKSHRFTVFSIPYSK